ncbi:MAG: ribonuclease P protein component [Bacilli bacterium]
MNKKYIISKNEEISSIMKNSKKRSTNTFYMRYIENTLGYSRYCISVSKKIGNAVVRNKCRRIVKDIITKNKINNSLNCVIIVKKEILELKYLEIEKEILLLLEEK